MKIYLAASFTDQKRIRQYKEQLIQLGHTVFSTWLEEQVKPDGMTDIQFGRKMAMKDLQEVRSADCFIIDLENPSKTMGKMVEYGFATAHHKLMYTVGPLPPSGIFLLLADKQFENWNQVLGDLKQ